MTGGIRWSLAYVAVLLVAASNTVQSQSPITFRLEAGNGGDSLQVGVRGSLVFRMESCDGRPLTRIICPLELSYSNASIIGPLVDWVDLSYTPKAVDVFDWITWKTAYSSGSYGPDTTRLIFQHPRDSLAFDTCGELWRMTFIPVDTGVISVDVVRAPGDGFKVESGQDSIPVDWEPVHIRVGLACRIALVGDTNSDSHISATDILCLAHAVLLEENCIRPCDAAGDMNCDGVVSTADVIRLVRHQFYGGPAPCNICHEITQGTWACP
jgi:hypothetical protein